MPELPEVETIRTGLADHVLGREVAQVHVLRDRAVRRQIGGAAELRDGLIGARFEAAVRRGKYLWLLLARRGRALPVALLVHLGMSGQLLVRGRQAAASGLESSGSAIETMVRSGQSSASPASRHLRVRFELADGGELWFVDQRTFGYTWLSPLIATADGGPGGLGDPAGLLPVPVAHVARDLLDPALDRDALIAALRRRDSAVKRALLDQRLVSGVGNIYADEGLWRAGVHGERVASSLTRARAAGVLDGVEHVMREALEAGGTSFDSLYVNVNGASGYFERALAVYGRAGQPCLRCGSLVRRDSFANRSSFTCPRCQRPPRGPRHTSARALRSA